MSLPQITPIAGGLSAYLEAVRAGLASVAGLREARHFPGRFTRRSLDSFFAATPAAWISLVETGTADHGAEGAMILDPVIGIALSDKIAEGELSGVALLERVLARLRDQTWGFAGCAPAREIRAIVQTDEETLGKGVALIGVTFRQRLRLAAENTPEQVVFAALQSPTVDGLPGGAP